MGIYSANELINQARRLAAEYRRTVGRPLPGIGGEIAEHDAIQLLGLEAVEDKTLGYDAIDPERNQRLQIKSRVIFDEQKSGTRIGQLKLQQEWDAVLLVLMDENYEPYEIFQLERDEVERYASEASEARSKRGALSIARFRIIGELRWSRENGLEQMLWSNHG